MRTNIMVILIASGMSIIGNLVLEAVGFSKLEMAGSWGREKHYTSIAVISSLVWLWAYHRRIKKGIHAGQLLALSISVPLVGSVLAAFPWGIIAFFVFWWVFIPISLVTACMLALVARQHPHYG
jgi:hypothetical protein